MGWASRYVQKLLASKTVSVLEVGDIVLCKVAGNEYLHIVQATQDSRYQIGNHRGFINGWIGPEHIYGKCVKIQP